MIEIHIAACGQITFASETAFAEPAPYIISKLSASFMSVSKLRRTLIQLGKKQLKRPSSRTVLLHLS
jgi:hypothetical protein